jgi:hypothetical protein
VGSRDGVGDVEKILDPTGTGTPTPLSSSQPVATSTDLSRLLRSSDNGRIVVVMIVVTAVIVVIVVVVVVVENLALEVESEVQS